MAKLDAKDAFGERDPKNMDGARRRLDVISVGSLSVLVLVLSISRKSWGRLIR